MEAGAAAAVAAAAAADAGVGVVADAEDNPTKKAAAKLQPLISFNDW